MSGPTPNLDALRAAFRRVQDARRIVLCSPGVEPGVKEAVDRYGWAGLVHVETSPYVPSGKVYIFDGADLILTIVNATPEEPS
jgi:hypothetical protein